MSPNSKLAQVTDSTAAVLETVTKGSSEGYMVRTTDGRVYAVTVVQVQAPKTSTSGKTASLGYAVLPFTVQGQANRMRVKVALELPQAVPAADGLDLEALPPRS